MKVVAVFVILAVFCMTEFAAAAPTFEGERVKRSAQEPEPTGDAPDTGSEDDKPEGEVEEDSSTGDETEVGDDHEHGEDCHHDEDTEQPEVGQTIE
ncbi:uncharacterized protein LOC134219156 [Armigeres subalbatus]|uniref:uncharacterized protein LOC134219156 n=1 Tax=Armigeres subalbatus TaxID=124917 RepID=UPI002ED21520